jgi:hypothetical protein
MNIEVFKDCYFHEHIIRIDFINYLNSLDKNIYIIAGILDLKHNDSENYETYCSGAYVSELEPLHRKIESLSRSESEDVGVSFRFDFDELKKDGHPDDLIDSLLKINDLFYAHVPLSWVKQLVAMASRKPEIPDNVRDILIKNISFIELIEKWLIKKREEINESRRTNPS